MGIWPTFLSIWEELLEEVQVYGAQSWLRNPVLAHRQGLMVEDTVHPVLCPSSKKKKYKMQ